MPGQTTAVFATWDSAIVNGVACLAAAMDYRARAGNQEYGLS